MQVSQTPLPNGTLLYNRYRILNPLGQGGMSRVYLAQDIHLNLRVAVKENLQTEPQARTQFQREAELLAHLSHPNLPRVIDHFDDPATRRQYLVMDYVEGEDLEAMVKRVGPLPEQSALAWIRQILGALEYLHTQTPPVIHRDIKPSNIKITPQGKAVLVDFGIAKVFDPSAATMTGARAVTPGYAPPEQYGMRTDERSDIYSLGATLYTMLTGRVPPEAPLRMSDAEPLIPPRQIAPNVSPHVEGALLRALAVSSTKRWQNIAQLREALEGHLAAEAPSAQVATAALAPPTVGESGTRAGFNWLIPLAGLAALAVIVLLFAAGLYVLSSNATPTAVVILLPTATRKLRTNTPPPSPIPPTPNPGGSAPTITSPPTPPVVLTVPPIGSDMVQIPAGVFTHGSTAPEVKQVAADCAKIDRPQFCGIKAYEDETPQRKVPVPGFSIDRFEVTNGQYAQCVQAGACSPPVPPPGEPASRIAKFHYDVPGFEQYPVVYVAWKEAANYCAWAGKRLPTEDEWEKAARGTDARWWPWGNNAPPTRADANALANFRFDGDPIDQGDAQAVGSHPAGASPYGVMDLAGNVMEWVSDSYNATQKVFRGGSWNSNLYSIRTASRAGVEPDKKFLDVGFRCAR